MKYSTLTHKGQVTIPIDLRKALGIQEGDRVAFTRQGDNVVVLTAVHKTDITTLCGCLPKPEKALSIEEINTIIESKK